MLIGIASTYYARHGGAVASVEAQFERALTARGAEVRHVDPLACGYDIRNGTACVLFDGVPLALDGLLVRRAAHHWNAVKTLVLVAHEGGAACVDRPETFLATYSGKFQAQLRRFRLPDAQVPPSRLYFTARAARQNPPPERDFPLLRKPVRGSLGHGIERLDTPTAFADYVARYDFAEPLLVQQVIAGQEYRALLLGDRCLGVVAKRPGPTGLGNFAQGAQFVPAEGPAAVAVAALGRALMAIAPYDFAALDVLSTPDGDLYVLELNRNPHFRGFEQAYPGIDVAAEVADFLIARVRAR